MKHCASYVYSQVELQQLNLCTTRVVPAVVAGNIYVVGNICAFESFTKTVKYPQQSYLAGNLASFRENYFQGVRCNEG